MDNGVSAADIEEATYLFGELRKLAMRVSSHDSMAVRLAATAMLGRLVAAGSAFQDAVDADARFEAESPAVAEKSPDECSICRGRHGSEVTHACE